MELNNESKDNNSQNSEIDLIMKNQLNDIIDINNKIDSSLSNKPQQKSLFKDIRQKIYHSLYENHSYNNNSNLIEEIIIKIEKYILTHINDIDEAIIELLETLMMLFLFHYDIHIIKIGFQLLNFLINNLEQLYSSELLEYFIKIIQLLNIKKQVNNNDLSFISSLLIYNISLAIYIIMSNNQIPKVNKKPLFDFIKSNINNTNLLYSIFIPCNNNSISYSKIFSNDEIKFIYEKISEVLNTIYTNFTNNLTRKKTDIIYIKENINKIGFLCKILDCVTIRGSRTYIIDKLIKNNIPLGQRILDTFNLFIELQNDELKFESETIENIFCYFSTLGVFTLEKIVKTISFMNKMYNDYSCDYLSIIIFLIQDLQKLSSNFEENKIKNIVSLIIQIIDIVLKKNKDKNDNKINLDFYEIYKVYQLYNLMKKIDPKVTINQNKYPHVYEFFDEKKENNYFDNIENGFNDKNFNYLSQIYLDSIASGYKENNFINKNNFLNCLNKFEDFKNSIKESLCIKNDFSIDKNIEKEKKEINDKDNVSYGDFEAFFLKNSMDMFKEIYINE